VILDLDVIDGWYEELEKMNQNKVREQYQLRSSLRPVSVVHMSIFPSTVQTEGVIKAHARRRVCNSFRTTARFAGVSTDWT
jgi:hypothetical protein